MTKDRHDGRTEKDAVSCISTADTGLLACRTCCHVKLQVCAGRLHGLPEFSKIANLNLCDPDGMRRFFVIGQ